MKKEPQKKAMPIPIDTNRTSKICLWGDKEVLINGIMISCTVVNAPEKIRESSVEIISITINSINSPNSPTGNTCRIVMGSMS